MALVDALVLTQAWQEDVAATFAAYTVARRKHLRFYRQASRILTLLFQSHRPLSWLRDASLYLARHTSIGKNQAVTTLIGARMGWLSCDYQA